MFTSPGEIAFKLGGITVRWYGVIMAIAFSTGTIVSSRIAKKLGECPERIYDLAVLLAVCAIIGARLYYVLFNLDYYTDNLMDIPAIWEGGISIHGALIGGFIGLWGYTQVNKLSLLKYADILAPGVIIGQAIGRWGNFFNSEAFGRPTDLPWKLFISPEHRPINFEAYSFFHPTFFYESIWNLIIFAILMFLVKNAESRPSGLIFFSYLSLYSLGRIFIESLRVDSIFNIYGVPIAQIASIMMLLIGLAGIFIVKKYYKQTGQ